MPKTPTQQVDELVISAKGKGPAKIEEPKQQKPGHVPMARILMSYAAPLMQMMGDSPQGMDRAMRLSALTWNAALLGPGVEAMFRDRFAEMLGGTADTSHYLVAINLYEKMVAFKRGTFGFVNRLVSDVQMVPDKKALILRVTSGDPLPISPMPTPATEASPEAVPAPAPAPQS